MREGSTGGLAEQRDLRIAGDKTNFYARKIFLPSTDSASNTNRTNVIGLRNEQNYDSSSARICDNMFWRCFDNSLYNHGLYFQRKTALRESEHLNIFTCTTNGLHYNCNRFPAYAQSHVVFGLQEWIAHLESSDLLRIIGPAYDEPKSNMVMAASAVVACASLRQNVPLSHISVNRLTPTTCSHTATAAKLHLRDWLTE